MPRQFGKVDVSAGDTWQCAKCPYRHAPRSPHPPGGVWLVLTLCPTCNASRDYYCSDHATGKGWVKR